ncbi:RecF/RecN/SMC N-terminal domain protein [Porphyromonas uenonis 60-3]|uniref:RecF/RecN/SMC N-terminal domain protein n=1 Tax=Porphyromonas uenonis 60-3 TaxID=596327 RepID=C2MCD2_9PORP|nr:AAA family ATPase [Porphyromonas uenonis]EEK16620.1 RecF/RecN/SMC N-terminal domain protein [Porphyromonas uenonis 60-3]
MYIKEIKILNFRNFKEALIPFHEGVNVIIGHNNTGKSNLLRAIGLVLGYNYGHRLGVSDLFYETDLAVLQQQSPRIQITLLLRRSAGEALDSAEMGLFSNMMTDPELSEEAELRYEFKLTDAEEDNYKSDVANATTAKEIWKIIDHDYIRLYRTSRLGGNQAAGISINETLMQIDFQFLDAIRDVSHDLYAGYNPLLRDVLNFFIDYSVKNDSTKTEDEIKGQLKTLRDGFVQQSSPLMQTLQDRLQNGKNVFLKYALDTGATFNGAVPDFDGTVTENEMFAVLRMIIKYADGIEVPATYNGLGYNNLIYMSLLLARMQADSSITYMKRNAKILSFLAVEECEAHLHPAMQYKFLQFLQDNNANGHVRQIFITSHSTQIASAVKLDDLICLTSPALGQINVGYPRDIYKEDNDDVESKRYVQRFLDATKADMFFANKLIFVEGIAEELLLPVFARYLDKNLTDEHVLVINMGGRYFKHFLKLFDTNNPHTINKKIVCLTDIDPCRKKHGSDEAYEACYPYEYNIDADNYDYKHHADTEVIQYADHPNIRFYRQDVTYGKTLEYDIMRENPDCELLLTDSVSNLKEIKAMMAEEDVNEMMNKMRTSETNSRIKTSIGASEWTDEEKRKALLASRYLNSVSKGSNALELNVALMANLEKSATDRKEFNVPRYIVDALTWLLS